MPKKLVRVRWLAVILWLLTVAVAREEYRIQDFSVAGANSLASEDQFPTGSMAFKAENPEIWGVQGVVFVYHPWEVGYIIISQIYVCEKECGEVYNQKKWRMIRHGDKDWELWMERCWQEILRRAARYYNPNAQVI